MGEEGTTEDLVRSIRQVIETNEATQAALAANAALLRACVERLEAGEDVVDVVRSVPGATGRARVKATEDAQHAARLRFRAHLIAACMAGGMSRKEIAANMGFSPQLVSRYTKAARELE